MTTGFVIQREGALRDVASLAVARAAAVGVTTRVTEAGPRPADR